ncbi:MAG: hypothetical protein HQK54_13365, partial [Oligoflexales bacterium]|nr:hypothetical protein [Oligoflexales bacterium]
MQIIKIFNNPCRQFRLNEGYFHRSLDRIKVNIIDNYGKIISSGKPGPAAEISLQILNVFLTLAILIWSSGLLYHDLKIPLLYFGDALSVQAGIKTIVETGWVLTNNMLGAPFHYTSNDFPGADYFHYCVIYVLSLFSRDSGLIYNIFFILTFVLTSMTTCFSLIRLKARPLYSLILAQAYSFAPYHIFRGENHIFLSAYSVIPLTIFMTLRLNDDEIPFFKKKTAADRSIYRFSIFNFESLGFFIICLLSGASGIYYAFYSCFFIAVSMVMVLVRKDRFTRLSSALMMAAVIAFVVYLQLLPSQIYSYQNGPNPFAVNRLPIESEIYGLKPSQMLIPPRYTFVKPPAFLESIIAQYLQAGLPIHENICSSLGLLTSLGFTLLLVRLFMPKDDSPVLSQLSVFNLTALLFAVPGGLSTLFAVYVSPQLRAHNRISIFISFFSLVALSVYGERLTRWSNRPFFAQIILFIFFYFGVLNQIPIFIFNNETYNSDRQFIQQIEQSLPQNAMIFQLPLMRFPENGPISAMTDYDPFKPYLHSHKIRWSYGSPRGRYDKWYDEAAKGPVDALIKKIGEVGFEGILIDTAGYNDRGADMLSRLQSKLKNSPLVSSDRR